MFDKALCIHYYVGVEHHQSADFERENSAMPTNPLTQLVNDHDDDNDKGKHQLLVKSKQRDYCSVNPRPIDIETQLEDDLQNLQIPPPPPPPPPPSPPRICKVCRDKCFWLILIGLIISSAVLITGAPLGFFIH